MNDYLLLFLGDSAVLILASAAVCLARSSYWNTPDGAKRRRVKASAVLHRAKIRSALLLGIAAVVLFIGTTVFTGAKAFS